MGREDDLLRRLQTEGDSAAMETFVAATRPRLVAIARRIGAPQDAEDSVQAAHHALVRRGALPEGAEVVGWLVTTVVRIAYRRKAVARLLDVPEATAKTRVQRGRALLRLRLGVADTPEVRDFLLTRGDRVGSRPLHEHHARTRPTEGGARHRTPPGQAGEARRPRLERRLERGHP